MTVHADTVTVREILVVDVSVPEVPVMVTADVPAVAVPLATRVSTLLPLVGLVANEAITPLGSPETVRVTPPVNPPSGTIVMVSAALPF